MWLILSISLRSIWLRKAQWGVSLFLGLSLLVLFSFALGPEVIRTQPEVMFGVLWAVYALCTLLLIGKLYGPEWEYRALEGWLAGGLSRPGIFLGKVAFVTIYLLSLQVVLTFFWIMLYGVDRLIPVFSFDFLWRYSLACLAFSVGSGVIASFVYSLTLRSLAKELLQGVLFFPLHGMLLLAALQVCVLPYGSRLVGSFHEGAWWTILGLYPVVFGVLGLLLSSVLFEE
jgi:ABC-type transport system involved in cytochrome c biogenesis permease component